jgi:predicted RNase H-like nuclease (RuvC/YqgF family)
VSDDWGEMTSKKVLDPERKMKMAQGEGNEPGQMEKEFKKLEANIDRLAEKIKGLRTKLDPVLIKHPEEAGSDKKVEAQQEYLADWSLRFRKVADRLQHLCFVIEEIRRDLAL